MNDPSASVSQVLGSQVCLICEVSVYMVCSGPLESEECGVQVTYMRTPQNHTTTNSKLVFVVS